MKHLSEEDLVLCYYGEPKQGDAQAHLRTCADCRQRYRELQLQLDAVEFEPVADPGEGYAEQVWQRIRWRLPETAGAGRRRWFERRSLVAAGAAACLMAAAFLVGRFSPSSPAREAAIAEGAREQILTAAVADHLERSERLLMELLNAPEDGTVELSGAGEAAADLLTENRLYRQTAAFRGDVVLEVVLDELERVLLEIKHSPESATRGEREAIERAADVEGTLFRIRVIGTRVREAQASERAGQVRTL